MASDARHVRYVLDGLVTQLTTAVPTAITDIAADTTNTGLTLAAINTFEVSSEFGDDETRLPYLAVSVEGGADEFYWMTPQQDSTLPLLLVVLHQDKNDSSVTNADRYAWEYCRAVQLAFNRTWQNITGVSYGNTVETFIVRASDRAKWRRQSIVRAQVRLRTNQKG